MRISDWSSDVCSSDLVGLAGNNDFFGKKLEHVGERLQQPTIAHPIRPLACVHGAYHLAFPIRQVGHAKNDGRSEEHTSELQSLMRLSYAVFCLKKKNYQTTSEKFDEVYQQASNLAGDGMYIA